MKENIKQAFSDKLIRFTLSINLIFMVSQIILVSFLFQKLPPLIPFLNSQPWGERRLFDSWGIFLVPTFLIIFFLFNNFLGIQLYKKNTLISRILFFNILLFSLLTFVALMQIIFLIY